MTLQNSIPSSKNLSKPQLHPKNLPSTTKTNQKITFRQFFMHMIFVFHSRDTLKHDTETILTGKNEIKSDGAVVVTVRWVCHKSTQVLCHTQLFFWFFFSISSNMIMFFNMEKWYHVMAFRVYVNNVVKITFYVIPLSLTAVTLSVCHLGNYSIISSVSASCLKLVIWWGVIKIFLLILFYLVRSIS